MKKSTYLLFALALIIFGVALYFYRKSYREIILYTNLINNSHEVLTGLEKLSGDLKASQIIPSDIDSSKINGLAEVYKRNAGNISADLANLQNNVLDPQNKRRVDTLNHQINQHLAWMLESNVHDTILLGRAPAELQALLGIQNLIDSSISRARTVMNERRETLEKTLWLNNLYILVFRVFSLIVILVTIALVFWHARQQARSRAFLDSILNSSQNGIITYKAVRKKSAIVDFKIVYANDAIAAQIGMQPSELIGKTVLDVNPKAKEIGLFDKLCSVTETQQNSHHEVTSSRGIFDVRLAKFMDG